MPRLIAVLCRVVLALLIAEALAPPAATGQEVAQNTLLAADSDWQGQRWPEAIAKCREVLAQVPDGPLAAEAHLKIAAWLAYVAPPSDAMAEYERAMNAAPGPRLALEAKAGIASLQFAIGDLEKARALFQEILNEARDWDQVKYATYRLKELDRKISRLKAQDTDVAQCGVGALTEVLRARGKTAALKEVAQMVPLENGMATLEGLAQAAEAAGASAVGVKLSLEQLAQAALPAIVHLRPNHYGAVTRVTVDEVELVDSEWGRTALTRQAFGNQWTGHALIFPSPGKTFEPSLLLSREEMRQIRGGHHLHGNDLGCNKQEAFDPGPSSPGCATGSCSGLPGLSVNLSNFNLLVQDTDFVISGRGPEVYLQRTYNADDSEQSAFGRSWTFNFGMTLETAPNGGVNIKRESGKEDYFAPRGCSRGVCTFNPPLWSHDTLVKNADGTYDLRVKTTRLTQRFDGRGRLVRIMDRNGNAVTLQYAVDGKLRSVADAVGRSTNFFYGANGKISRVVDPGGREATYRYDGSGNLVGTTDMVGNQIVYTYDANSYMTSLTTPRGTYQITNVRYSDPAFGLVVSSITDPLGNSHSYSTPGNVVVEVVDGIGKAWHYLPMNNGEVTAVTDPLGNTTGFSFNAVGDRTGFTDAQGRTTSLTYDARGNITSLADPLRNRVTLTYDEHDNLTRATDHLGKSYRYAYDARDNLTSVTDPANDVTRFSYDSFGQLTALIDARSNTTRSTYDSRGNLVGTSTPLGKLTSFTYDGLGRRTGVTTPNGNAISYTYDGIDRLSSIAYPDGNVVSYSYACCSLSSITDRSGTLSFTRDTAGRLTSYRDALGHRIGYAYDRAGNLTGLTYPDGSVVTYGYDTASRLQSVVDWLGNRVTYRYNAAGDLVLSTASNGIMTAYQYDGAGRLSRLLNFRRDATVLSHYEYTVNPLGQRVAVDAQEPLLPAFEARSVASNYDADNRLLTAGPSTFVYDEDGSLLREITGRQSNSYSYDFDDRLVQAVVNNQASLYEYDRLGNRISKTTVGVVTRYVVDPSGPLSQALAESDVAGNVTSYYVYGLGLVSKITSDGRRYSYQSDGSGHVVSVADDLGNMANRYTYDPFGNLAMAAIETTANSFRYAGRFGVLDDQDGILFMRARYYWPSHGRFLTKDPIGLAGGFNFYTYLDNSPLDFVDPSGLQATSSLLEEQAREGFSLSARTVILGLLAAQLWETAATPVTWEWVTPAAIGVTVAAGGSLAWDVFHWKLSELNSLSRSLERAGERLRMPCPP